MIPRGPWNRRLRLSEFATARTRSVQREGSSPINDMVVDARGYLLASLYSYPQFLESSRGERRPAWLCD